MSDQTPDTPFYFQRSRQSPIAILLILAQVIRSLIAQFWPVLLLLFLRRSGGNGGNQLWSLLGIGIAILSVVRSILTYFRTYFYIQDEEFILEKGGFTRRRLNIPLDKIQTITFQQSFLHRLFDVVSIEMDTSGAKGSEITINALERSKASALRDYLLRWKKENAQSIDLADETAAQEPLDRVLLRLDTGDLLRIGISQNHLRSAGILIGLGFSFSREIQPILGKSLSKYLEEEWGITFGFFWTFALWIIIFFLLVSVVVTLVLTIIRFYNLRFVQTGDGFRLEAGLFTQREQLAYLPKIQFLSWSANPLQRIFGMFNLRFYQAAGQELSRKQTLQVPGCYPQHIHQVQEAYFPGASQVHWTWHTPHRLYYIQRLIIIGFFPLLLLIGRTVYDFSWLWLGCTIAWFPLTMWWQWNLYRRKRYGLHPEGCWMKTGFFTQTHTLLLWKNVQAVKVHQSFLEKRRGVCDLSFYTASGDVELENLPQALVDNLRDYVLARLEVPQLFAEQSTEN